MARISFYLVEKRKRVVFVNAKKKELNIVINKGVIMSHSRKRKLRETEDEASHNEGGYKVGEFENGDLEAIPAPWEKDGQVIIVFNFFFRKIILF